MFADMNRKRGTGGLDGTILSGEQLLVAGAAAGLANSVVSGPVEHIRISKYRTILLCAELKQDKRIANSTAPCQVVQWTLGRSKEDLSVEWCCGNL
jgi:hypothetical protein